MNKKIDWKDEYSKFLIENQNLTIREQKELFNKKYGENITKPMIEYRRRKLGIKSEYSQGTFKKGHTSWLKGKKQSQEQLEKMKKTMFKKGHIPTNAKPIGNERIDQRDESVAIKIQDGHGNRNWMPKGRYIYEKKFGPIPPKHKLIFADGNNRNFDLDNLLIISNAEELIMNNRGLMKKIKN